MVCTAVFKSWNSLQIVVEKALKINTKLKNNNILVLGFEAIKQYFKGQHFIFQQDGTPTHSSTKTPYWCRGREYSTFFGHVIKNA